MKQLGLGFFAPQYPASRSRWHVIRKAAHSRTSCSTYF